MMLLRRLAVAVALVASLGAADARSDGRGDGPGIRVYLLRGLGDDLISSGIDDLAHGILARLAGAVVLIGNWRDWPRVVRDAEAHVGEPIVIVGFSVGSEGAGRAANALARNGVPVKVIGLDPLCAVPSVAPTPYIDAVNFYGNRCGFAGRMAGARNVRVGEGGGLLGHVAFPSQPIVQDLVLDEIDRYRVEAPRPRR